jgi:predicted RNA-binding Zn-ribbon protein involved in translation (DUF1610 family)
MPLSCSCDYDWEPEPGEWNIDWGQDWNFEPLLTKKRKRCASCGKLIEIGSPVIIFKRHRFPYTEAEARITGGDWEEFCEPWIPMSPIYHCERCGEIFLNLHVVGFECLFPSENMPDMLAEYIENYNPPKMEKM